MSHANIPRSLAVYFPAPPYRSKCCSPCRVQSPRRTICKIAACILFDADGDGVGEEHQSCAISLLCDAGSANCPQDLALLKLVTPDPCFVGGTCAFIVEIQNIGAAPSAGPTVVTDIPDIGLGLPTTTAPGWACAPAGGGYSCTNPAGIAAGGGAIFNLTFPVPAGYALPTVKNCADLAVGPPDNTIAVNDHDCATGSVPFPDLAPFGGTTCKRGKSCTLDVRIDNKGKLPFIGAAGLHGTLTPPVKISSIKSASAGFACSVTGNGVYDCKGANSTSRRARPLRSTSSSTYPPTSNPMPSPT